MGQPYYQPPEGSPIWVLYHNTYYNRIKDVADDLEVSIQTVIRWNNEGNFPHWALEQLGFEITFGPPETPLNKLLEAKETLDNLIKELEDEG